MLHPPHTPVATSLCILLISIYENFDLYGRGNLCIYEDGMGQKSNADKTMDIARYATACNKAKLFRMQTTTMYFNRWYIFNASSMKYRTTDAQVSFIIVSPFDQQSVLKTFVNFFTRHAKKSYR